MIPHIAQRLADVIRGEPNPGIFTTVEVIDNGPEDMVVECVYHEGRQTVILSLNAVEEVV